ncbi:hypothetical protein P7C71_g411, partial [Lecanoromycetidae sp. Uapishka_2]
MAYTDDAVKAKLSALNETQESIVTVAQWVMFHRRHADRTGTLWLNRLKDSSSNKRLNLIYLANEVAQQSKARRKEEFINAFSPIIAEATAVAYKGATEDVKSKLRRVVEVWRQRQIFDNTILVAIEARIDDIDKSRASNKKPLLGGSLFSNSSGPSAPSEIQPLVPFQIAVSKAAASTASAVPDADADYDKLSDPTKPTPTAPVHAARLSALVKSLANAEGAVSESIKARRSLVEGLEKIIESNRAALTTEEAQKESLTIRKNAVEAKKREVEDGIMRGIISAESTPVAAYGSPGAGSRANGNAATPNENEPERPDVEDLTPPPESRPSEDDSTGAAPGPNGGLQQRLFSSDPHSALQTPSEPPPTHPPVAPPMVGADLLSSLSVPPVRHYVGSQGVSPKKRKIDDDYPGFGEGEDAMANLDDDVAELLRAESGGR